MELKKLQQIYDENFWNGNNKYINYNCAKLILPILFKYYKPNSIIDVGCGIGSWLKAGYELGVNNINGIDCNNIDNEHLLVSRNNIRILNLETNNNINNERYDLAISLEVAEHLDVKYSEHFIKTLTTYSDVILFSAAIPYQKGEHHVNCQPPQFWCDIFLQYGYTCFDFRNEIKHLWYELTTPYSQNILLFAKSNMLYLFKDLEQTNRPRFYYHSKTVNSIITDLETENIFLRTQINNIINSLAWWIPIRKWRDNFRNKILRPDQTRPDQTRPDQTRPDQTRPDQTRPNCLLCSDFIA